MRDLMSDIESQILNGYDRKNSRIINNMAKKLECPIALKASGSRLSLNRMTDAVKSLPSLVLRTWSVIMKFLVLH